MQRGPEGSHIVQNVLGVVVEAKDTMWDPSVLVRDRRAQHWKKIKLANVANSGRRV